MLARTDAGKDSRVILAGHLDTVPIVDNVPSRRTDTAEEGAVLHGCGTVDMKSGLAVFAHLAATLDDPRHDLTLIFYDCEEIAAEFNGLGRIERELPGLADRRRRGSGEPTAAFIEGGAGTLRVRLSATGTAGPLARAWRARTPSTSWLRVTTWPPTGRGAWRSRLRVREDFRRSRSPGEWRAT